MQAKKLPAPPNPIAARIRAAAAEQGLALREVSRRAGGISETTAQKTCENLEAGRDVGVETLTAIARGLGRSVTWLLHGEEAPAGVLLRDLEGWDKAAAEAVTKYRVDPAAVDGISRWTVHVAPGKLDAHFVVALARAWSDAS